MTNTFLNYLKNNFYDQFFKAVQGFCIRHRCDLISDKCQGKNVGFVTLEDLDFRSVSIADAGSDNIAFIVVIIPEIGAKISLGHGDFETVSVNNLWVICSCWATIGKKLRGFRIVGVDEYSKVQAKEPLDGDLVPFIKKEDFSKYADKILSHYYPEALDGITPLDPRLLAERMGLSIIERQITQDYSIFGQLFFETGKAKFYDRCTGERYEESVEANTIVIDPGAVYLHSYNEENLTIAHECVHAFFHRKAFNFTRMLNGSLSSIVCSAQSSKVNQSRTLKWMEWQANSIAPYLLTPTKNFKNKVYELYKKRTDTGNFDVLTDVPDIIAEIADYYGITKQAARRRLIDIGCEAAVGCLNWMDDHYVPTYRFKKGSLNPGETYTVSSDDIGKSVFSCADQNLLAFISNGAFVYVENHLVIRNEKFVETDEGGSRLTDYARRHLDECAVKFKVQVMGSVPFSGDLASICYLCKNSGPTLTYKVGVSDNKSLTDSPLGQEAFKNEFEDRLEIERRIAGLPLHKALVEIQNYREIPNYKLASRSCINERTLRRYLKGDTKVPNKRILLALCVGLRIHNLLIINRLLSLAGLAWNESDPEDDALREIFQHQTFETVEDANALLIKFAINPLTKE